MYTRAGPSRPGETRHRHRLTGITPTRHSPARMDHSSGFVLADGIPACDWADLTRSTDCFAAAVDRRHVALW